MTSQPSTSCCTRHQVLFNNTDRRERHKPPAQRIQRSYAGKVLGVGESRS